MWWILIMWLLKGIFRHGLKYSLYDLMPDNTSSATLEEYIDHALFLSGSLYTVGIADEERHYPTVSATPKPATVTPAAPRPATVTPAAPRPATVTPAAPRPATVTPAAPRPATVTPAAPRPATVTPAAPRPATVTPAAPRPASLSLMSSCYWFPCSMCHVLIGLFMSCDPLCLL